MRVSTDRTCRASYGTLTLMNQMVSALVRFAKFLWQPRRKQIIVVGVLVLTLVIFVHFFAGHPQYITQLRHANPWSLAVLMAVNAVSIGVLALVYNTCVQLCGKRLDRLENILLTAYSSIVNFFGPLQSGPGARAVYLRTRHHIRLRDYFQATLLYYALFATISALFLVIGTLPWWLTILAVTGVIGVSYLVLSFFAKRNSGTSNSAFRPTPRLVLVLAFATLLQVVLRVVSFYTELRMVNPHISIGQAISYTGAANFSLFVSLTPDAIGFRESFLYLSQHLHHVSTANILTANVIDRAVYVAFLGLLFIFVLSLHAKERLQSGKPRPKA